ncbi:hypothetical protein M8J76_003577 [Diaphorina citri]|nr:hypothetical protein M8J75_013256 [Diaphorina citri]KAI5722089.1 hypothetical protein M8J76_003577 [Diaphorina citri]
MSPLFAEAYLKASTPSTAINGFRACGIVPLDPSVFGDVDFAPAEVTDQPGTSSITDQPGTSSITDQPGTSSITDQPVITTHHDTSNNSSYSPPSPASISSSDPSNVTPGPSSTPHPAAKKRRASTLFSHSTSATSPTLEEMRIKWLELEIRKSEKRLELAEYKAKKLKMECHMSHILNQQVAAMEPQQADERNVEEVVVVQFDE